MTTLELFKKHRAGEISRERFLYEVRRDNNLPWVTNVTSYDDAVKILKNKGIIREEAISEAYEVHYSDGVRQREKFKDAKSAIIFAQNLIKHRKGLQNVDVFKAGPNFHSTADANALVAWWGPGSYFDNLSKKDSSLLAKQIKEETKESINEAQFEPQNITTDPIVDRVNPYALKREVQKLLAKEPELTNDAYKLALNKAAKKLTTPEAVKKAMFSNADTVEKADVKLRTKEVKKNNLVDKDNGMKKIKGQETLKAQAAPTKENKKGKPKGVEIMKESVIEELINFLKKKDSLKENSSYHIFHKGMEVPTPHGKGTIEEINAGTLTVMCEDGKLYDIQMNTVSHFMEKEKEAALVPKEEAVNEINNESNLEIDDRIKVVYGNQFYGQTGTVEDIKGGFVIVSIDGEDGEYSMHSSDVEKIENEEPYEDYDDELDEARDINDPALVNARAKLTTPSTPVAAKEKDLEILRQIKALKREKFQVMRDMEQEAEPEGGPIADDYADRLMDLDQQIKDLEAKLSINEEDINEAAHIPSNIAEFAKRKGITSTVKKVATWVEKAGKKIRGGTAIGKNYSTLILDLNYQDGAIHINTQDRDVPEIELYGEPVYDAKSFAEVLADYEKEEEIDEAGIYTPKPGKKGLPNMVIPDPATEMNPLFKSNFDKKA